MAEDEKNKGGRPRLYDDPALFEAKVEQYFDKCDDAEKPRIPTVAGLAYELGFASRQSLLDYEKDERFSCAVSRARLRIEMDRSERLVSKDQYTPGLPMDLASNHGWTTARTETDANVTIKDAARTLDDKLSKYADAASDAFAPEGADD
ncbi:terminase small subunit [Henriciella sp.]|uniref:terminase small subunit n=1 Tax=Henriciella sp. TaxID=1968823 RepID=UPI002630E938|nr:terminase small subunit [Henriciella sp.]